jgi:phosphoglucomutase
VYWENGVQVCDRGMPVSELSTHASSQIIGPHDTGISDSIKANLEPWEPASTDELSHCVDCTEQMCSAYIDNLAAQSLTRYVVRELLYSIVLISYGSTTNAEAKVKFVNTSIHGVGHPFVKRAFETFGFEPFVAVEAQKIPDPEFPTVKYPNPEEKGPPKLSQYVREKWS